MATLIFKLEEQLLTKQNEQIISSGDVNIDRCNFLFDKSWEGFVKTAVFYQDKSAVFYAVLDNTASCFIPSGAMKYKGKMHVGVFGIKGASTLTSTLESIDILSGAISGITIDVEPSDDIFLAIIAQYQAISEKMEAHNQTAETLLNLFEVLDSKVDTKLTEQDAILSELHAFDVIAMKKTVEEIQATHENFTSRMESIEINTFTFHEIAISFTNKVFRINDERITVKSLVDAYFSTDTFNEAVTAKVVVESFDGYVQVSCENTPKYPLYASFLVRRA